METYTKMQITLQDEQAPNPRTQRIRANEHPTRSKLESQFKACQLLYGHNPRSCHYSVARGRWGKYLILATVRKRTHDCNIALILWVGIFSEGPCPQTNPLRMSLKYKTVAHGVHSWCVCPCLCRKFNGGWAWLAVGLSGLVTEHTPAASIAKGTLKPALSSASSCPLAVCFWAGLRSWAAGVPCCPT